MYGHAFFAQKFLLDSLELKCLNFHQFRLHWRTLKKIGDRVELLAAEMWTSHRQLFLCHQYTLPMLVKRVVEGGYMVSLELCYSGGAKRAAINFFLQLVQHWWQLRTAPCWRSHYPGACRVFSIFFIAHEVWIKLLKCLLFISWGEFHPFDEELQKRFWYDWVELIQ